MRVSSRSLRPGEFDRELFLLCLSLGGLLFSAVWLRLGLPWPICWFHELTGFPCATCGATRAAIAFLHGDWAGAWAWNPLALLAYCGIAAFDLYALGTIIARRRRLRFSFSAAEKNVGRVAVVTLLLVNWGYLLAHASRFGG
jgi:hypothetical protein